LARKNMAVRCDERRCSAYYSVIDDDWPDVRADVERRLAVHLVKRREGGEG
jgi:hypothetical protein